MVRELIKDQEAVKFRWNEQPLEKHEVHIYRYDHNRCDGYFHDEIMLMDYARTFWTRLVKMGFVVVPLAPPPSYED